MGNTKKCNFCGEVKHVYSFYEKWNGLKGLHSECKECCRIKQRLRYKANREKLLQKSKEYAEKNKEQIKAKLKIKKAKTDKILKAEEDRKELACKRSKACYRKQKMKKVKYWIEYKKEEERKEKERKEKERKEINDLL